MDKKTFLAIVLSLAVVFTWQLFLSPQKDKKQPEPVKQETTVEKKQIAKAPVPEPVQAALPAQAKTTLQQAIKGTQKDISVETPRYSAIFTTVGGALKSFKLKGYQQSITQKSEPIELVARIPGIPRNLGGRILAIDL